MYRGMPPPTPSAVIMDMVIPSSPDHDSSTYVGYSASDSRSPPLQLYSRDLQMAVIRTKRVCWKGNHHQQHQQIHLHIQRIPPKSLPPSGTRGSDDKEIQMEVSKNMELSVSLSSFGSAMSEKKGADFELYNTLCDISSWKKMIELIFTRCYDLDSQFSVGDDDIDNDTPLTIAAKYGSIKHLKALVMAGAEVNKTSAHGMTPLQYACGFQRFDITKYLIQNGALVDCFDLNFDKPVIDAMKDKCLEILNWLLYKDDYDGAIESHKPDGDIETEEIITALKSSFANIPALVQMYQILLNFESKIPNVDDIGLTAAKEILWQALCGPKTLQACCKSAIRHRIVSVSQGFTAVENVKKLPLPKALKNFLRFGVMITEEYVVPSRVLDGKSKQ